MKRSLAILIACMLLPLCTGCGESAESAGIQQGSDSTEMQESETAAGSTEKSAEIGAAAEDSTIPETEPPVNAPPETEPPAPEYTVRPAEWEDVQWTQYECLNFTLTIPEGWEVQWQGDAEYMTWQVKSPDNSMLGVSNTDHAYAAKDASMMQTLGMNLSMSNGTVQEFFETLYAPTTDYYTILNTAVPANAEEVAAMNPSMHGIRDYRSCYAIFAENGIEGEGIYQAAVMDNQDIFIRGQNYASWYINAIFTEYAPRGELVNWMPVLNTIINSFRYTDYYLQQKLYLIGVYLNSIPSTDTDSVVEAFEERMTEDEIIQAKRSDMIGEYERVYDNETGNIYRAYDGFLDDIGSDQTRYSAITDSQYAEGYVGWIDK